MTAGRHADEAGGTKSDVANQGRGDGDTHAPSSAPRTPLNRERVLRAALVLADEAGIGALTMRRLAQSLGVEAMSLYNHVANKDDIITGILDLAMREIEPPQAPGSAAAPDAWKTAIRDTARSTFATLLRHPWACQLMMAPERASLARLQWMESVLRTFREAGFSVTLTHHAYHALDSYLTGFTMWVATLPPVVTSGPDVLNAAGADMLQRLPQAEFTYFHEHVRFHLHDPAVYPADDPRADESTFEFALTLLLDGLERLRDTTP